MYILEYSSNDRPPEPCMFYVCRFNSHPSVLIEELLRHPAKMQQVFVARSRLYTISTLNCSHPLFFCQLEVATDAEAALNTINLTLLSIQTSAKANKSAIFIPGGAWLE